MRSNIRQSSPPATKVQSSLSAEHVVYRPFPGNENILASERRANVMSWPSAPDGLGLPDYVTV
jgi:hypothetical protein